MSLEEGLKALQQQNYTEAVAHLEEYCQHSLNRDTPFYIQGRMALARAYRATDRKEQAIEIAQELTEHKDRETNSWARSFLSILSAEERQNIMPAASSQQHSGAGRAAQTGVRLAMPGIGGNLAIASGVTISLLFGMVMALCLALLFILSDVNPLSGLIIAVFSSLLFNTVVFFVSPWIMDLTQQWLYKTRWVTLAEIKRNSPESAAVIQQVCREKRIDVPRLGIIDDGNPTAFTYGSLPNQARLVVSQGLFTYLDDDEAATVYAHELGHIVHWDFAIMTLAATLVQITYLIYIFARRFSRGDGDNKIGDMVGMAAIGAYIFYIIGTYLLLYLSRTREYFADHFAAEATGNPNGLSRALVKIAYGILEQKQNSERTSTLLEGTRSLGIYDANAAVSAGTAYRVAAEPSKVGRVFLWDLFNPWGWWMELNSTHPLTGKRVRALSTYAEQMDLPTEFNMSEVVREGNSLDRRKLYSSFIFDIFLYNAQIIGIILGLLWGSVFLMKYLQAESGHSVEFIAFPLIGFGIGTLIKMAVMYPNWRKAKSTDILTLMSDPYASPLRGRPVKLKGEIIGRGDAGYQFGSDMMLQDATGMIFTRFSSRFGGLGNFMFGGTKVQKLIGQDVQMIGWFRRSVAPWMDWVQISNKTMTVKSHHRFWQMVFGVLALFIGSFLLFTVYQA